MEKTPPGWYDDKQTVGYVRWWNGETWTEHFKPLHECDEDAQWAPSPAAGTRSQQGDGDSSVEDRQIGFFNGRKVAHELSAELKQLKAWISENELDKPIDALKLEQEVLQRIKQHEADGHRRAADFQKMVDGIRRERAQAESELQAVKRQLIDASSQLTLQDLGVHQFKHPAESSTQLSARLQEVRSNYKRMVSQGSAYQVASGFTFNDSISQGNKFLKDMSKLLLRAYNAEAESVVKGASPSNLETSARRLNRCKEQVEKLGSMIDLRISGGYHRLRLEELELSVQHLVKKRMEKELEKERRAEMREQKKVEEQIRKEKEKVEKELSHYQNVLAALEEKGDVEGVARMKNTLEGIQQRIDDLDYRAANVKAGYVYVISNIGAFGEGMVKIGMTRRLDPMDRVRELGDASVPFRFDVHALFFSEDAVGVERQLHELFAKSRVNHVNTRREFFRVSPADVGKALDGLNVEVVDFTTEVEAHEFRQSQAIHERMNLSK